MYRLKITVLIVPLLAAVLFTACSDEKPTEPANTTPALTFAAVISSGGEFNTDTIVPSVDTIATDTTLEEVVGSEDFFCTRRTVSVVEAPADFPLFDPNADLIFPGNLLQGASLVNATPDPIPVGRGPGTIAMVLNNGADSVSRTIPEVNLSNVLNAQNQIIGSNPGALPARFSFSFEQVRSVQHLALALDVGFENLSVDVKSSLAFSSDREYNRFVVKLNQSFFTMAYQLPTTTAEIFSSDVTPERLSQFVGPGNPPAFISSVTFGRKFYLLVESTSDRNSIEASLNASFSAAIAQGELNTEVTYVSGLENVRIKAYALGGEASAALGAIGTDFEALKTFLAEGGTITTGIPLSYVVRSLADPSKIVKSKIATEYDLVDCIPIGESVDNPIVWFRADQGVATSSGNLVTKWSNFFGKTEFDAQPPTNSYGGQYVANALPGPNLPAIRFAPGAGSSANDGQLQFSGVNFNGSDFTIWVVARLESQFASYPEFLLTGSGTNPGSNLRLGFRTSNQLTVSNLFDTVNVPMQTPVDEFKLYTIRFSQKDGVTVYVNGSLDALAAEPTMKQPLVSFLGTRLGSAQGNPLQIAEFKAYGTAVSELQRKSLDKDLLIKYGL